MRDMLDAVKLKRNWKGIPTSVLPSEQARVDRIRQIMDMDYSTVQNALNYNSSKLLELDEGVASSADYREKYLEDNRLLDMFGYLNLRDVKAAEAAEKFLRELINGGKTQWRDKLERRKVEVERLRARAIEDATFGTNEVSRRDAQRHSDTILRNETLPTLLRLVSGKRIEDFDDSVAGELYSRVEDSTQEEATAQRRLQEDFDSALHRIAHIGLGKNAKALLQKGRFFRLLNEKVDHSGVFKTEYMRPRRIGNRPEDIVFEKGRRKLLKKYIPIEDYEWYGVKRMGVRSLLRRLDNGDEIPHWDGMELDDIAVAFLRQQLADYDAGLSQTYDIFNDEGENEAFRRLLEEEKAGGKLVLFTHDPNEISETREVSLTQGSALQILLTWEQDHYKPNMKWNGWTEESIEQLKKFIKPEVLRLGYWMRDQIAGKRAALDAKVYERYGAHLPLTEKYYPGAFLGPVSGKKMDGGLGKGAGSMSINPNFLIARKFHLNELDTESDAVTNYLMNQLEQAHFLAWGDVIRDIKAVYGNHLVQKSIADNFGAAVTENLVERVATIARGGGDSNHVARLMNKMYRHWVPAKIALNISSYIKQLLGTFSYMNHIPVVDYVRYSATANFLNADYREFAKWALNSDYMKNRLSGGLDKDLNYLLNYTRDSARYSGLADYLLNCGTYGTRKTDAWSALHGGYAAYKYAEKQALEAGYSASESKERARRMWMRWTDETQQSGYLKDQNYYQANQAGYRYLTAFMSNPIQVMNLQLQTLNELRYGKDKKQAWKKLGRQVLVNHLVIPTLMKFTTDMLRYGFNVNDWWDEVEFEDYFLAWLLGSFESLFLWGKLVQITGDAAGDLMTGRGYHYQKTISAIPLLDDLVRDGRVLRELTAEDELTEKEAMDGLKLIGDVGMLAGTASPGVGAIGAMINAVGTQGKRVISWLKDEPKKEEDWGTGEDFDDGEDW